MDGDARGSLAVVVLADGVPALLLLALTIALVRAWRPLWLQVRGHHAAARALWEPRSQHALLKSSRQAATYNVAACLLNEGRLEEALAVLRKLDGEPIPPVLRAVTDHALSTALVLLGREPAEVIERSTRADARLPAPYGELARAHAMLSMGDREAAILLARSAREKASKPSTVFGVISVRWDPAQTRVARAYLDGWFLERTGDREEAKRAYAIAADAPRPSVFVTRARDALQALSRDPSPANETEPTSLAGVSM